jgi:hypothetical protein
VLIELRQLEAHARIVHGAGQCLVVGERSGAIAASFRDVRSCPYRAGRTVSLYGSFGPQGRRIEGPSPANSPRYSHEILGGQSLEVRLTVETHERRHSDDVPRVVLDDPQKDPRVARAQEVQIKRTDVRRSHVVGALEAENGALERRQSTSIPEARSVNAPRDVQEIEMGRLLYRRQARHD